MRAKCVESYWDRATHVAEHIGRCVRWLVFVVSVLGRLDRIQAPLVLLLWPGILL